jgi:peptidylprolyl isomerase
MMRRLDLRALVPVHLVLIVLVLGACGSATPASDSSSTVSQAKERTPGAAPERRSAKAADVEKVAATGGKPHIAALPGPLPKKLVVRKLKQGSGSRVRRGDRLGARFIAFNYKTKRVQDFWEGGQGGSAPYLFALGQGRVRKGWEIVLPGQRLGTRLELLLPSRLAYGDGPMRYVVELLEREKPQPDRQG